MRKSWWKHRLQWEKTRLYWQWINWPMKSCKESFVLQLKRKKKNLKWREKEREKKQEVWARIKYLTSSLFDPMLIIMERGTWSLNHIRVHSVEFIFQCSESIATLFIISYFFDSFFSSSFLLEPTYSSAPSFDLPIAIACLELQFSPFPSSLLSCPPSSLSFPPLLLHNRRIDNEIESNSVCDHTGRCPA